MSNSKPERRRCSEEMSNSKPERQAWNVLRLEPQVCFSCFFLFFILLMIYLLTGKLRQHQHQHLAPNDTNGKKGPNDGSVVWALVLLLFIRFEDADADAEVPQTSEPRRQKTQMTVNHHLGRISTGCHVTQHHTSITTMTAFQPPGQRDGATTGSGRVVTTKKGPNDARRVVWALIGTFFSLCL